MVLAITFGLIWLIIFLIRKDLRKEIWVTSLIFSLMGFTEVIFSEYWTPNSLFGLVNKFGFGLEDIMFCFFLGGISATILEFVLFKKEYTIKNKIKNHHTLALSMLVALVMFSLELFFPRFTIFTSCSLIFTFVLFCTLIFRPDLLTYLAETSVLFMFTYIVILEIIFQPSNYFHRYYHFENLSGIIILGVPMEEYIFGLAFGCLGAFIYKFFFDKRVKF